MERNKVSSEDASLRTTPEASSGTPQSASSSYQSPDHPTQDPRIWTLTNTPRSTSLMAANTPDDSSRTEVWTSKEITESRSSVFSKPSFSSMSTASDKSTLSISMASDSASSSTETCKTPAAARNVVVMAMDDNDKKIIHPSVKSDGEVLNVDKDAWRGSIKEEAVITMGLDDEEESESESFREEVINKSKEADTTTGDAIIDIMGSDNDNEEISVINEKSKDGKSLWIRSN